METNFTDKIEEIERTIDSWKYRVLTPLGRNVIAKTLLLSKLSYVAIVLPTFNKKRLKYI